METGIGSAIFFILVGGAQVIGGLAGLYFRKSWKGWPIIGIKGVTFIPPTLASLLLLGIGFGLFLNGVKIIK